MKERLLRAGVPEEHASELQEEYESMGADEQSSRDQFLAGVSDSDIRVWAEGLLDRPESTEEPSVVEETDAVEDDDAKAKAEAEAKEKAALALRGLSDR